MSIGSVICDAEVSAIDKVFEKLCTQEVDRKHNVDLDPMQLCSLMVSQNAAAHCGATIGASFVKDDSSCLMDDTTVETVEEKDCDSNTVTS